MKEDSFVKPGDLTTTKDLIKGTANISAVTAKDSMEYSDSISKATARNSMEDLVKGTASILAATAKNSMEDLIKVKGTASTLQERLRFFQGYDDCVINDIATITEYRANFNNARTYAVEIDNLIISTS